MSEAVPTIRDDVSRSAENASWTATIDPSVYAEIDETLHRLQPLLQVEFLTVLVPFGDGQKLFPVSTIGFAPELARGFSLPLQQAVPNRVPANRTPVVVEDPASSPSLSPLCRLPAIDNVTIIPLTLDGRFRGVLHVGSRDVRTPVRYSSQLLDFAEHAIALAVDRAELRRAEAFARKANVATRERLTFLAIASGLLSSSLDYETTLSQITGMLVPRLADICAVVLIDDDGLLNQVAVDGTDPLKTQLVRDLQSRYSLPPGSHSAVRRVLDTGKTAFHPRITDDYFRRTGSNDEHVDLLRQIGMRSMIIVPLNGRHATIGALSMAYVSSERSYTIEDVDFIEDLAHRAALAVENARLYGDAQRVLEEREEALRFREETLQLERAARARAEAAQRREAFLSEASNVLSTSFDTDSTLGGLARLVVARAADWFTIELFDESGSSSMVAAAHADSAGEQLLHQIRKEYVPVTVPELSPRHLLRYREPALINRLPEDFWFDSASTPQQLVLLDRLDTSALIVVPLFVRKRVLGVMMLGRSRHAEPFDRDDLPMAVDLGHRVALSLENSQLYQHTQHVLLQQEEFISTASHELKTPLTTVKGYLQLINRQIHRDDQSPSRLARFTEELDAQVRRLEDLVSDLLDVSRIQQGRLELRLERFDLAELAAEVLARFEHAPERLANHELTLSSTGAIDGEWDRGRLDQVLTNLVSNALKYSPNGGQVLVRIRQVGDAAQIMVRDNGIGIRPEERARLFQPFARGRSTDHNITGTGLGLYITQRIVQNHHGEIFVKSAPGKGTTFIVQLPLVTPSDTTQSSG